MPAQAFLIQQARGQPLDVHVALAAFAGGNVELQIAVAAGNFADALQRRFGQRRASQVGVQDHTRSIDDRTQRRRERLPQPSPDRTGEPADREFHDRSIEFAGSDLLTQGLDHLPRGFGHRGAAFAFRQRGNLGLMQQLVNRRQLAVEIFVRRSFHTGHSNGFKSFVSPSHTGRV